jgi:hypothetical protein
VELLKLTDRVKRGNDGLSADLSDRITIMSVAHGKYLSLDAIGRDIWHLLAAPVRVSEICTTLSAKYDGSADMIERDTLALLERLREFGLVEIVA